MSLSYLSLHRNGNDVRHAVLWGQAALSVSRSFAGELVGKKSVLGGGHRYLHASAS